jgi:hypothetical protein
MLKGVSSEFRTHGIQRTTVLVEKRWEGLLFNKTVTIVCPLFFLLSYDGYMVTLH